MWYWIGLLVMCFCHAQSTKPQGQPGLRMKIFIWTNTTIPKSKWAQSEYQVSIIMKPKCPVETCIILEVQFCRSWHQCFHSATPQPRELTPGLTPLQRGRVHGMVPHMISLATKHLPFIDEETKPSQVPPRFTHCWQLGLVFDCCKRHRHLNHGILIYVPDE